MLPSLFACCAANSPPQAGAPALFQGFSVILKIDELAPRALGELVPLSTPPLHAIRWFTACVVALCSAQALAQERIYRCPGKPVEYINNGEIAKSRGCTLMDGGNITIIQGTAPQRSTDSRPVSTPRPASSIPTTRSSGERIDTSEQRARDSDARAILDAELRKAQERLAQAQKAYANGAPEKEGIESRNHQRYLDRVAELKAAVARAESDVSGIQRELGRFGGATGTGTAAK